jgi:hypothetical protein
MRNVRDQQTGTHHGRECERDQQTHHDSHRGGDAKLEQEAQMFGFLESPWAWWAMGSPQQMQMLGFIFNYTLRESRRTRRTTKSSKSPSRA